MQQQSLKETDETEPVRDKTQLEQETRSMTGELEGGPASQPDPQTRLFVTPVMNGSFVSVVGYACK